LHVWLAHFFDMLGTWSEKESQKNAEIMKHHEHR